MTVLLPTRRAARALREAFLRLTGEGSDAGAPLLLPRMRPIGDLDADELALGVARAATTDLGDPAGDPRVAPPAAADPAGPATGARSAATTAAAGQAAALAAALARLLDAAATEGADFAELRELAPDDLAEHWQIVLRFLEILPRHWPRDARRGRRARPGRAAQPAAAAPGRSCGAATPPRDPVIAAGLTGGIPALDELLGVVAGLDTRRGHPARARPRAPTPG